MHHSGRALFGAIATVLCSAAAVTVLASPAQAMN